MLSDMGADIPARPQGRLKLQGPRPGHLLAARPPRRPAPRPALSWSTLKDPQDKESVALIDGGDAIIEGYRPGVMERSGLWAQYVRAQPASGVWAHDGLARIWPPRTDCGT